MTIFHIAGNQVSGKTTLGNKIKKKFTDAYHILLNQYIPNNTHHYPSYI